MYFEFRKSQGIREEILAGTLDDLRSWRGKYGTDLFLTHWKENGMPQPIGDSGHPVFRSISALSRGTSTRMLRTQSFCSKSFCKSAQYLRSSYELFTPFRLDRESKGTREAEKIRDQKCMNMCETTRSKTFGIPSKICIWKQLARKYS